LNGQTSRNRARPICGDGDQQKGRTMVLGIHRTGAALTAAGLAALVAVAGCSSSGGSKSGGGSGGHTAEATGNQKAQVSAAAKKAAPFLATPTKIKQTVPLTGKIPTAKPWVVVSCELPQCQTISAGASAAAKAAGVPIKILPYKTADGTTETAAMKKALTYHPIAVSPIGGSKDPWTQLESQYKSAGVLITPIVMGDVTPGGPVTQGSGSQLDQVVAGAALADYVVSTSGANAHVLVQDVPAFSPLKAWSDGFTAELSKACSDCKSQTLDVTPTQVASSSVVPAVVAALRKDRSINYLVSSDGALLIGLSTALKAAGITNVKVVGGSPSINNLTDLKSGASEAWTGYSETQLSWVALDIIGRTALKMTVPAADGGQVVQILTKDNVGAPSPVGLGVPTDYQDQFKKLWGVS
jgi:ribose transport system substrate-binding protein